MLRLTLRGKNKKEKFKVNSPWGSLALGFSSNTTTDLSSLYYSLKWAFSFHCFLPLDFERIDPDPEKFNKFWLVPTFLVLKFLKDLWHYVLHSASLSRQKGRSSSCLEYLCCQVFIRLKFVDSKFQVRKVLPLLPCQVETTNKQRGFSYNKFHR